MDILSPSCPLTDALLRRFSAEAGRFLAGHSKKLYLADGRFVQVDRTGEEDGWRIIAYGLPRTHRCAIFRETQMDSATLDRILRRFINENRVEVQLELTL